MVKSNITKTNTKNATQFKVKSDHPEYHEYFQLDNPKYLDHQLKTYFPKIELTQNSLQDIIQRGLNANPGAELEKATFTSNKYYLDIKNSIDKANAKVQEIIQKQEEGDKNSKAITLNKIIFLNN